MRTYAFIVTAIAIILAWLLFDQNQTNSISLKAERQAREFYERKANEAKKHDQVLRDSIELAFKIVAQAHNTTEEQKKQTNYWRGKSKESKSKVAEHQVRIDSLAKADTSVAVLKEAYENLDSLSNAQGKEITLLGKELEASGKLVYIQGKTIINKDSIISNLEKSLSHAKVEIKLTEKHAKKKGFLRGAVVGGVAGLLLILLL
jgi:hypothetical protein